MFEQDEDFEDYDEYEEEEDKEEDDDDNDSEPDLDIENLTLNDVDDKSKSNSDYLCPKISKYETARIIGVRAREISEGGAIYDGIYDEENPLVPKFCNPIDIAIHDYNNNQITYFFSRTFQEKKQRIDKLIKFNDLIKFPVKG